MNPEYLWHLGVRSDQGRYEICGACCSQASALGGGSHELAVSKEGGEK